MNGRAAAAGFTVCFSLLYPALIALNHSVFVYLPVLRHWQWQTDPVAPGTGPAMAWYGLVVTAAAASLLLQFPLQWLLRGSRFRWLWLFPLAAALACAYEMRLFFIG